MRPASASARAAGRLGRSSRRAASGPRGWRGWWVGRCARRPAGACRGPGPRPTPAGTQLPGTLALVTESCRRRAGPPSSASGGARDDARLQPSAGRPTDLGADARRGALLRIAAVAVTPGRSPTAPTGDAKRGTPNRPGGRSRRVGRWKPRAGVSWPGTCGRPPPAWPASHATTSTVAAMRWSARSGATARGAAASSAQASLMRLTAYWSGFTSKRLLQSAEQK
jgi:hypothetical protein